MLLVTESVETLTEGTPAGVMSYTSTRAMPELLSTPLTIIV